MRFLTQSLLICTLLTVASHCSWKEPPPQDTLVMGLASVPKTLDPRYATDANGQRINNLIFSSLVRSDENLKPIGDAAESWTYDNLIYTFKMKPNIKFHNGDPLTREDILYSFQEFKKPLSPFAPTIGVIKKVEAEYGKSGGFIKLHLKKFTAPFISDLSTVKLLSKKITEAAGKNFYENPIGTGVFQYDRAIPNNVFLKAFPGYFAKKAKSNKIQFKIIKDANTRFQKVYKGKIDIVQSDIPSSKIKIFDNSEKFKVHVKSGLSTTYLLFNLKDKIFKDRKVRLAIQNSLNPNEIIDYTLEGMAEPATAIISRLSPFFNYNLKNPTLTPEQIAQIFSQLKDFKLVLKTSNEMAAIENGKILSHQLRKAGLSLEQQSYEWGTYYEDIRTGKFQMAIMKWVGIADPDIYRVSLHSKMVPPGRNRGQYSNKKFDKLVEQGLVEPNFEKRKFIYDQVQQIAYHDLPTIPLWYEKQVAIVHKRVKNYSLPPNGDFRSLTTAYKEDDGN